MIADRNLYLDKSRDHLALENSVESAFLLNGKGQEIDAGEVARLRLVVVDGRVMQAGAPLNLTDEERANLPPLGDADPNEPYVFAEGPAPLGDPNKPDEGPPNQVSAQPETESHGESEG